MSEPESKVDVLENRKEHYEKYLQKVIETFYNETGLNTALTSADFDRLRESHRELAKLLADSTSVLLEQCDYYKVLAEQALEQQDTPAVQSGGARGKRRSKQSTDTGAKKAPVWYLDPHHRDFYEHVFDYRSKDI